MLNDGSRGPMPDSNPLSLVPLAPEPVRPFNVVRDAGAPILTRTELTNYAYQHLLAGTPWQYYRLVVTQWPRLDGNQAAPIPASLDGSVANTFPGAGAFSAFANVTMETFDSEGRAARVHELPQPRAHDRRLHVDRARSRVSLAARARRAAGRRHHRARAEAPLSARERIERRARQALAKCNRLHILSPTQKTREADSMTAPARLIAAAAVLAGATTGLMLAQGAGAPAPPSHPPGRHHSAACRPRRGPVVKAPAPPPAVRAAEAAAAASRSSPGRSRRRTCSSAARRSTTRTARAATRRIFAAPSTARTRTCCARASRSEIRRASSIAAAVAKHSPAITLIEADTVGDRGIHPQRARDDGRPGQPARTQSDERHAERARRRCQDRRRRRSARCAARATR